ncbi:putative phytochrome sensor protein [Pirellula staleyi DSM 6068]|uniref:Putative phytochrome sensor protein n=1 Tax=Pirellula staleyi (strain ATCC 27377 / DSM 6068 / ICPB 4128) TaxID=530564 RepID=D2R2L7_PIRSD|nr:HlyD family efflux transporter periplasmic adaptor subunit [Pirellula staleyi]ADB16857.1 putative phytochrome sensor protein [Pirellula staleyi DSM 6068]
MTPPATGPSLDTSLSGSALPLGSLADAPGVRGEPLLVQEMKNEIRSLVQEIATLAQAEISHDTFADSYLTRVISAMGAIGGAIWVRGETGKLKLLYQSNLEAGQFDASPQSRTRHGLLLKKLMDSPQSLLVPPQAGAASDSEAGNPSSLLLVLASVVVEGEVVAVVEILQRPGGAPTTQRGYLRFLVQMSDIAAEYFRNDRLRQLSVQKRRWNLLQQFVDAVHRSLDPRATSYAVVNEGRRLIECDRVSIAIQQGRRAQIEAVSGLDNVDRRAAELSSLERLIDVVLRTREPLWHAAGASEYPPEIEKPLDTYLDISHAALVAIVPLYAPAPIATTDRPEQEIAKESRQLLGALVIENLTSGKLDESLRATSLAVAHHASSALQNSQEHSQILLLPLWKALGRGGWIVRTRAIPKTIAVLAIFAAVVIAGFVIPADFEVAARGKLQPVERREVFAMIDGIVREVPVRHGQLVERGQPLATLTSTDLEVELAALIGRQTTNQEQIASHQRMLLDSGAMQARLTPADENRISGELLQLKQEQDNIEREIALFREKQELLAIVAPQRGQVVTWKVEEVLLHRPVIRGQSLMTLANPDGEWELELLVPERRLLHIDDAQHQTPDGSSRPPLEVTFVLSSHPSQRFTGTMVELERTAEVRGEEGNCVLMRVAVNKSELPLLQDQTTVTAKIYCGRQPIARVWLCDLIETVQSKILFWL